MPVLWSQFKRLVLPIKAKDLIGSRGGMGPWRCKSLAVSDLHNEVAGALLLFFCSIPTAFSFQGLCLCKGNEFALPFHVVMLDIPSPCCIYTYT